MPNYFITNTARFNPFSYQELALPLIQATEAQYALEDSLAATDDGTLEMYLAGEDSNSPYRARYDALTQRLQAASNELASRGLNPTLMREIRNLKSDYKKFQTPVEAAGKRMLADRALYNKAYSADSSLIGDNPNEKNLQFYIDNPDYSPQYTSGKNLMTYGMLAGKELASNFTPTFTPILGNKYYQVQTKRTARLEDIQGGQEYQDIVNGILTQQGFDPNGTDALSRQARQAVEVGMATSMQDPGIETKANPGYNAGGSGRTPKEKEYAYTTDGNTRYHKQNDRWVKETRQADNSWSNAEFVTNEELEQLGLKDKKDEKPPKYDPKSVLTGTVDVDTNGKDVFIKAQDIIDNPNDYGISNKEPATVITDEQAQDYMRNTSDTLPWYNDNDKSYVYLKTKSGRVIKLNQREFAELRGKVKPGTIIIPNDPNLQL